MLRRVKVHNVEFILLSVYITSKLLWDKIPYIFELFFWLLIIWHAFTYIYAQICKNGFNTLLVYMGIFSSYVLIDALLQDSMNVLLRSVYEYLIYLLIVLYFINIRKKIDLIYCLKVIVCWGGIIASLTWYEYATKQYILNDLSQYGVILNVGTNGFRAAVFTRSFLSHAVILGVFSIMSLYLWYILRKKRYLLLAVFSYMAILATGSRGPLVSFFVSIIFFYFADAFIIRKRKSKKDKFILVGIFLIILFFVVLNIDVNPTSSVVSYFIYRVQNIFNWTGDAGNTGRILIWTNSINNWFIKNPIFGIGPSKTGSWGDASLGVTESGLLKRLCELGIVGAFLFYKLIFNIVRKSTSVKNMNSKKEMILWLSIFAGIFINDMTVQSTEEIMVSFWFYCALGGIYYLKRKDKKEVGELNNESNNICNER